MKLDIWILSPDKIGTKEHRKLALLANNKDDKCCLDQTEIYTSLNGVARVLIYKQPTKDGPIESLEQVYEGRLEHGDPGGFGRLIDGNEDRMFVGFFLHDHSQMG